MPECVTSLDAMGPVHHWTLGRSDADAPAEPGRRLYGQERFQGGEGLAPLRPRWGVLM
jgi:hypothetical protein